MALADKYIGLGLAISSSLAIGTSFIITKKGLQNAGDQSSDNYEYLKRPLWWAGIATMALGEIANFAAYTFAPAILVTPLGALSVIIGAVLASVFLKEELGLLGKLGCALCLTGSVVIILHAPPDKDVQTVDEILAYAVRWPFLVYVVLVLIFSVWMIYGVAPKYGKRHPMVYISICSAVGSISVMSIKAFGIALKLTFGGSNQFTHPSTYVFIVVVVICILTQMNYFNRALDQFDTSIVNPLYYVTFTTCTLLASFILFGGFNTSDVVASVSLVLGFGVIFIGVYILNVSRAEDPRFLFPGKTFSTMPIDNAVGGIQTRRSMTQSRNSRVHSRMSSFDEDFGLPLEEVARRRVSGERRPHDALLG